VSTTEKTYSMAQLRATKKSLFVRNNTGLPWTLHEKVGNGQRIDLELRPAGQQGSVVFLPKEGLDAPGVSRNMYSGKISVSPDLEDDMVSLEAGGVGARQKLLDQFQVGVEESAQDRAIDGKGQMDDLLATIRRKRAVTSQGAVGEQAIVDEFINPSPIPIDGGGYMNPRTGELVRGDAVAADNPFEPAMPTKVTITQSGTVKVQEN
jgi:hypothetical protein